MDRERRKVAREGWGARLLARQDTRGTWGGGLYTPKWISTTYTMLLLRDLGVPATNRRVRRACRVLLDEGLRPDGGISFGFWRGSETCVTGMVLSILAAFEHDDARLDAIAGHLLERQMHDGGWNCRHPSPATTHASVHTTISALEGLHHYELHRGRKLRAVRAALQRGREFLLVHRLFRSHRTGAVMKKDFVRLAFPPRWHYDILRALDHFQTVGAPRDERLADAIGILREREGALGRWPLEHAWRGKVFFELERVGAPSRWNTLRALRVLKWWDAEA